MPLKMNKVEYIEVNYSDLDEFVKKVYPNFTEYSFSCAQECSNDSSHSFKVNGHLNNYEFQKWNKFKNNNDIDAYCNCILLNKLCAEGYIPEGNYLVKVSW